MNIEENICMVIAYAGESRCNAINAIELGKEGKFAEAEEMFKKAEEAYNQAHVGHHEILVASAQDESKIKITYLLVHMSDILLAAELMLDVAKYVIYLQKEVKGNA